MEAKIVRNGYTEERCFPPVANELKEGQQLAPDQQVAKRILALADRRLPAVARFLGWGLNAQDRLGRLLANRCQAIAAEQRGEWRRADFFWRQAHRGLRNLYHHSTLWVELAGQAAAEGAESLATPETLRTRLLEELFIDVHCAIYNGREEKEHPDEDRAFVHGEYLRTLMPLWDKPIAEKTALLSPVVDRRIRICISRNELSQGLRYCRDALRLLPGDIGLQNRFVELHLKSVDAEEADGDDEFTARRNASTLWRHTRELLPLCRGESPNLSAFQAVGHLHCRRARFLARAGVLAEALESVERGLTYHPSERGGQELRGELSQLMTRLKSVGDSLLKELANQPGAQLNAKGQKLVTQARLGSSLAERFAASGEAEEARLTLRNLFEGSKASEAKPAKRVHPTKGSRLAPPFLATPARRAPADREPGWEWLWSREDLRIKLQAACALGLLALAGFWFWQGNVYRSRRDAAYQRVIEASTRGEQLPVLAAAADFLKWPKRGGQDRREDQVWQFYSKALTLWIVERPGELDDRDLRLIEEYRRLSHAHGRQEEL